MYLILTTLFSLNSIVIIIIGICNILTVVKFMRTVCNILRAPTNSKCHVIGVVNHVTAFK